MVNGKVVGLDIISLESAYADLLQKLIKSYAIGALFNRPHKNSGLSIDDARLFIAGAMQGKEKRHKSVGHGWDFRFSGDGVVGSSLIYRDSVIHLAFFTI
jgi:hypothetical protein